LLPDAPAGNELAAEMPVDAGLEALFAQCELVAQMSMYAGNSAGILFEHIELNLWGFPATFAFCIKNTDLPLFLLPLRTTFFEVHLLSPLKI